ncbi:MAG: twitching motility protein PilT [Hydrogenophilales bacterium 16-64-46]|nr:MAG: twitching motility protein PilT [Hydrogenophilales bacterium 12-64-13]OYZ07036.1 MAG: twitching motility protein PilT [Hydrogenophilales bacterium 16-64-46]OZA37744.1 MAG: twitching motility protein PilT [Hydrogenophilales bacterium 17-64-34]HQS99306.1 type II toxin-antitoxin system VapC family toxin [Thiobacillus sp.]
MNLLLDTHLLLWAASEPKRLSARARALLLDPVNHLVFSAASLWEISIKNGLDRADFHVDPRRLWRMLLVSGYRELPVTSEHTVAVNELPSLHRDPFDRILVAQARVEGLTLLTVDKVVAKYGDGVRKV